MQPYRHSPRKNPSATASRQVFPEKRFFPAESPLQATKAISSFAALRSLPVTSAMAFTASCVQAGQRATLDPSAMLSAQALQVSLPQPPQQSAPGRSAKILAIIIESSFYTKSLFYTKYSVYNFFSYYIYHIFKSIQNACCY
jgi:hypothetical protein